MHLLLRVKRREKRKVKNQESRVKRKEKRVLREREKPLKPSPMGGYVYEPFTFLGRG